MIELNELELRIEKLEHRVDTIEGGHKTTYQCRSCGRIFHNPDAMAFTDNGAMCADCYDDFVDGTWCINGRERFKGMSRKALQLELAWHLDREKELEEALAELQNEVRIFTSREKNTAL